MCRLVTGGSNCHTLSAFCTLHLSTLPGALVCVQLSLQSWSQYGGRGTCFIFPRSPSYSSPRGTCGTELNAWSFSSEHIHVFLLPVQLCCIPRVLGRFTGNVVIAQTVKPSELDLEAISHPRTGPAITSYQDNLSKAWLSNRLMWPFHLRDGEPQAQTGEMIDS